MSGALASPDFSSVTLAHHLPYVYTYDALSFPMCFFVRQVRQTFNACLFLGFMDVVVSPRSYHGLWELVR